MDRAEKETAALLTEVLAKLEQAHDNVLEAFGSCLGLRDAESEGHSQRVTAFSVSIGKRVPVPNDYLPVLARAAFLHDIGKIAIPDAILHKPRPLTDDEKKILRSTVSLATTRSYAFPSCVTPPISSSLTMSSSMGRAIRVACAANRFLSAHASSPSPMPSTPC